MKWQKIAEETSSLKKNHLKMSMNKRNMKGKSKGKIPSRMNGYVLLYIARSITNTYHGGFSSFSVYSVFKMASTPDEVDHFIIVSYCFFIKFGLFWTQSISILIPVVDTSVSLTKCNRNAPGVGGGGTPLKGLNGDVLPASVCFSGFLS